MDFQGSSLRTRCEILDARPATAALPRGFGARFVGLPLSAARAIDAIVRNVLLAVLLEPDAEPAIPTLSAAEPQSR